ncbi:MAG: metal-dependent hydrolase [Sandaracinus sp.]
MDNVTHTLAGAAFAEVVARLRAIRRPDDPQAETVRGALWLSSMLASNAPDLDIVLTGAVRSPLGYLLHHRGHTHTIFAAPVLAALSVGVAWLWARKRGGLSRGAMILALALATAMGWLHVAMDYGNSYGVHPFWPFSSRWHFGDSIFIVEPLLWSVLALPLAFSVRSRGAKAFFFGVPALGALLSAVLPFVTLQALALVVVVSGLTIALARMLGETGRAVLALFLFAAVETGFFLAHGEAEVHARGALAGAFPRERLVDVVMSPSPGNPLCWQALGLGIEGDDFVARHLAISLDETLAPIESCRIAPPADMTVAHAPIERSETATLRFFEEMRTPLARLRAADDESEEAAAFLRFARAPYVLDRAGEPTIVGDLRFDREAALGFGELELHEDGPLGGWVPSWEPPRIDVLDPTRAPPARTHDIVTE